MAGRGPILGQHRGCLRGDPPHQAADCGRRLNDSPAGLAAWIVEKLRAWSDCGGDVERSFTRDEILTNLTIYWLTGTIGSSMRMYQANAAIPPAQQARRVEVPSGFAVFLGDVVRPPRAWLERTANVVRITEPPRGGHFAPFEEPELYAEDLRDFFRPYRRADGLNAHARCHRSAAFGRLPRGTGVVALRPARRRNCLTSANTADLSYSVFGMTEWRSFHRSSRDGYIG